MRWGRIIGAGIGFATGGIIGALIGGAIGSLFDNVTVTTNTYSSNSPFTQQQQQMSRNDFYISLLVLMAAVMKADGVVKKNELNYVKQYLLSSFGEERAKQMLKALREVLEKEIPLQQVCAQIRTNMMYESRLELIHFLYNLAQSDGVIDSSEFSIIEKIADFLGISSADAQSIKSTFFDDLESAYKTLEITSSASDDEIKKAYKQMAIKYHPDKVSHLGEEVQKSATEKFRKVNEAYERIKKNRNIK
jgi:DnaJ like chaperone protein